MKNFLKVFCGMFLLFITVSSSLFGGNGKIAGVVKDNAGKPNPGVTVMIEGTKMGGAADIDGRYFILNVPPGKYNVIFTAVGYKTKKVNSILISSDKTTELNAVLEEAAVQVDGVVVEAERKLVDKTLTSTKTTIGSEELGNALPVTSTFEIMQTAPSVYKGFIRGGRQSQTKSIVEGVDISDEFYAVASDVGATSVYRDYNAVTRFGESQNSAVLSLNSNAISEMTVNTGALGSEYASATAGVINYALKEGKGALNGKLWFRSSTGRLNYPVNVYADDSLYFKERDALIAKPSKTKDDSAKLTRYTYTHDKYGITTPTFEGNLNLSGSITDDIGFFLSSEFRNNPDCNLPNQTFKQSNSLLKFTFTPSSNLKITAFGILDDRGQLFGWKNTNYNEKLRFYLNGLAVRDGLSWTGSVKLTHFLSTNTFYEVQVYNVFNQSRIGFVDGNNDGLIGIDKNGNFDYKDMTSGDFLEFRDTLTIQKYLSSTNKKTFFAPSDESDGAVGFTGIDEDKFLLNRPGPFFQKQKKNKLTTKIDFTSQVNFNHQLKAGLSYTWHDIEENTVAGFIGGYERAFATEQYHVFPKEFSGYLADRMEYAGLIINVGLRADMFTPKVADYANYWDPYKVDSIYEPLDNIWFDVLSPKRKDEIIKAKWFVSPRIAVSHPVSDNASVYFSFAKMQQPQAFSTIYGDLNQISNLSNALVNLTSRDPVISTKYELGGTWAFMEKISVNLNAYYNNMENYQTAAYQINERVGIRPPTFIVYFNTGYANARGVELQLDVLPHTIANFFQASGRLTYAYAHVQGSYATTPEYGNINQTLYVSADSAKFNGQLPFDNYKIFTRMEAPIAGGRSALNQGYDRAHRIGYTMFLRFPYEVSLTSIGLFRSGFYYTAKYSDPRTQGREYKEAPWTQQVDIKLEKAFTFGKYRLAAFMDVRNLFDSRNIQAFDDAGSKTYSDKWETDRNPTGVKNRAVGRDGTPFYEIPREIYFGISLDF